MRCTVRGFLNKERKIAKKFDSITRTEDFTKIVYGGGNIENAGKKLEEILQSYTPEKSIYNIYFGEMHGHTYFSDALPDIDTYFHVARDLAQLDFCAVSDHDHGGVGCEELWGNKWKKTRDAVKKYYCPNRFVPILAYERDSYPWYNNLVVYFNDYDKEIPLGSIAGEITAKELVELLKRKDAIVIPHTTSSLHSGCDFDKIPLELMTPLIEVYSRWGTDEYFGNPNPVRTECRGGFWQDALKKGAKMGCVCGSDDHQKMPGMLMYEATHPNLIYPFPGLTAVLVKELTIDGIFEALKARRCYGLMGGRIDIDFRINGHYMGEEIVLGGETERFIWFSVKGDKPVKRVTVIKNGANYICFHGVPLCSPECIISDAFVDYSRETHCDYFYLRVELTDGRFAWTSPIWINQGKEAEEK